MVLTAIRRYVGVVAILASVLCWNGETAHGQGSTDSRVHRHVPIDIDAPPIVSRLPMIPIRPRRLLLEADGTLIVADWGAGTVARVTAAGTVRTLVTDLNEPAGLARDAMGNLFVATHAEGLSRSGTIVKVDVNGEQSVFADGLTGPTGLVFDDNGYLYVAEFDANRIIKISPVGEATTFVDSIPSPAALTFGKDGRLYAASSTEGNVYGISAMGAVTVVARGLQLPSDLATDSRGHLIVANFGGRSLSYLDLKGHARRFAAVPKGTIAVVFDADNNLLLANWDQRLLMKVTTHLSISCPHCGRRIPLRLIRKRPPKKQTPKRKPERII